MNETHFNDLSQKTQLQIWENNELLEWLNAKARKEEQHEHQLQAYKDKEDKLRELIKATPLPSPLPSSDYMENFTTMFMFKKDILDILNEGDK